MRTRPYLEGTEYSTGTRGVLKRYSPSTRWVLTGYSGSSPEQYATRNAALAVAGIRRSAARVLASTHGILLKRYPRSTPGLARGFRQAPISCTSTGAVLWKYCDGTVRESPNRPTPTPNGRPKSGRTRYSQGARWRTHRELDGVLTGYSAPPQIGSDESERKRRILCSHNRV